MLLSQVAKQHKSAAPAGVIPEPRDVEYRSGSYRIRADTPIVVDDESLLSVARRFAAFLSQSTGYDFEVKIGTADQPGAIGFHLSTAVEEAGRYTLEVSTERITISAGSAQGAFYATQSLRQLLPPEIELLTASRSAEWCLRNVRIDDAPRFSYRGMHLDVARHFFPVAFIKRFLDWMALHKLNTFHWHLTDDQGWRIESLKYPRLTEVGAWREATVAGHTLGRDAETDDERHGGYYTQDEIRELVAFAADRFITVIPEIDLPGHSSALLAAYPEFGCRDGSFEVATHFGIFNDVLCPSEQTLSMIADVLGEVAGLFPGPYLHIGGDEADKSQWRTNEKCRKIMQDNGLSDVSDLHRYFVRRVDRIVSDLGKKAIAWDDVLDGGGVEKLAVVAWRGVEKATQAARDGHDVIVSPGVFYFDCYQSAAMDEPLAIHGLSTLREIYEFDVMPDGLDAAQRKQVLGAQGALWTEYIATESHAEYMLLPRMCALAEQVWSHPVGRSWSHFCRRLRGQFQRFDCMGINASRSVYTVYATVELMGDQVLCATLHCDGDNHDVRYTLDGSRPTPDSPVYRAPIVCSEPTSLRASAEDRSSGRLYGDTLLTLAPHKALGCKVRFAYEPETDWGNDAARVVVNGVIARDRFFLHREWAGFHGRDMDAVVDLGRNTDIGEVGVGFDVSRHRRLHPPGGVEVMTSQDGEIWSPAATATVPQDHHELRIDFEKRSARFVRVICRNDTKLFSHESRALAPVSIYVDEIVVR